MTDLAIENWREATEQVADTFVERFFLEEKYSPRGHGSSWVGDEIGGVFCISDMFFSLDRMIEAIVYNATFDQLCDYDAAEIEYNPQGSERPLVNFRNYVKYGFDLTGKPPKQRKE